MGGSVFKQKAAWVETAAQSRPARLRCSQPFSPFGHAMTKRMLHEEWDMSIEQAIEAEAQAQAICMQTEDFKRAFEAFAAKRKPVFGGD